MPLHLGSACVMPLQSLAGIVDSGTSCLVFPGHNVHGYLKHSPFALFSAASRSSTPCAALLAPLTRCLQQTVLHQPPGLFLDHD